MKSKRTVKTKIKQLVRWLGGYQATADSLQITLGYVYKMEKGLPPSKRLYRDILRLHDRAHPPIRRKPK
jgi:hypothetical protein